MPILKKTLSALTVAVLATGLTMPAPAEATVPLNCGGNDLRSPMDKKVRQAIPVATDYGYATFYDVYVLDDDDNQIYITAPQDYLQNTDGTVPLVGAWENGTGCDGNDDLRNLWAVSPAGQVFGSYYSGAPVAQHYGDMYGQRLNKPIVGMSPISTGKGYWLVASDGGIFSYGEAQFYGSTGNINLNKPIVGMSVTPSGAGYWLVASDGGIFAYGDARFHGSTGSLRLNRPITGMVTTPSGNGYWMTADDGGIFSFGDAQFKGSLGSTQLSEKIVGMMPNGTGYSLIGETGTVYPFN